MDTLVKKYVTSHLIIRSDGKPQNLVYIGYERDHEAVFAYVQSENIAAVKRLEVQNKIMHDLFTDQINIMHVIVNGERKSTKLDYPASETKIQF